MASKKPDAPVCGICGRSEGITGMEWAIVEWRRGAWRYKYKAASPEEDEDEQMGVTMDCPCGAHFSEDFDTREGVWTETRES